MINGGSRVFEVVTNSIFRTLGCWLLCLEYERKKCFAWEQPDGSFRSVLTRVLKLQLHNSGGDQSTGSTGNLYCWCLSDGPSQFWCDRWTSGLLFWMNLVFWVSEGFWWAQASPWMLVILWTACFRPSKDAPGGWGTNPPPQQTSQLCVPTLHWIILQLFKHWLPVPVGQTTLCQITEKRYYERGSIANSSSELLSQADWGGHWESMYPARRCRLDFVFLSWHDGQQYWMSFIPCERAWPGR